jgi:hypothetical protein
VNRILRVAAPVVGIIGLMVMGLLAERKASRWRELAEECVGAREMWSEVAHSAARSCSQQVTQYASETSSLLNELSAAFCRERVTGCTETNFKSLMRKGDGVYECRCGQ